MDTIGGKRLEYEGMPCLASVMKEWGTFKMSFYKIGGNALKAKVFGNSGFFTDNEEFVEEVVPLVSLCSTCQREKV